MIALLVAALPVLAAASPLAPAAPRPVSYVPDRLMVCLRPGAAARARSQAALTSGFRGRMPQLGISAVDRAMARYGATSFEPEFRGETPPAPGSDETDFTAFWIARWPNPVPVEALAAELRRLPDVEAAEPIAMLPVTAIPNDSLFSSSTWFYDPATRADIHGPEAWDVTLGDPSVVIAILDTGVLPFHPDIGGVIAGQSGQIWTNVDEANGAPGSDDELNGFVDDVHGWDFVDRPPDNVPAGEDYEIPDNDPSDFAGHGTMVAGVAAAITNNTIGAAGVAGNVRLMPLRVGLALNGDPLGLVFMDHVAAAIRYATRMKATVINCSFESQNQFDVGKAAAAAIKAGVTVVVSAGNSPLSPDFLMSIPGVIGVAATGPGDAVVTGANLDPEVDLSAPGVNITSTFSQGGVPSYNTLSGTSFSAPMVAGAAALVQSLQKQRGQRPLIPQGMLLRLYETADDISALNPGVTGYGAGRLNVGRALTDAPTSTATVTGANVVGAAMRLPTNGAEERIAYSMNNRRLIVLSGQSADTLVMSSLAGFPFGSLAGAEFNTGFLMFQALSTGRIHGMAQTGSPLSGWPVDATGGLARIVGCAIGDLDGDGLLEIVAVGENGILHAYDQDGNTYGSFPIDLDAAGTTSAAGLADFDGDGAMEIAVTTASGLVHLVGADGLERAGFPQAVPTLPRSAVIGRLSAGGPPTIVVTAMDSVFGFLGDGTRRFAARFDGTALTDPVLGDLDGDGAEEILIATSIPELQAFDSAGVAKPGWPVALTAFPTGEPVVGSLQADQGTPTLEALIHLTTGLRGFAADGTPLKAFPKPIAAGVSPSLVDIDGDDAMEVLAGTGTDSILYVFDAGKGSAVSQSPAGRGWPTLRGNYARTGSHDVTPPSPIATLAVDSTTQSEVRLHWTAPPNEGHALMTVTFLLRGSESPIDESEFESAPVFRNLVSNVSAGDLRSYTVGGLAADVQYHFVIKTRDQAGNLSKLSNEVVATTKAGPPVGNRSPSLAAMPQPSPAPVSIHWRGEGTAVAGQRLDLYDLSGALIRSFDLSSQVEGVVLWNGTRDDGSTARSGVYFARLWTGARHVGARIVLVR